MKIRFTSMLAAFSLPVTLVFSALAADQPPSLGSLQGKWSVTKTNAEGRVYSQVIEIKKDQLTFQIFDAEDQLRLVAKGTLKAERAGPFEVLLLSDIRGGRSPEEMESVDDSRTLVYTLRDDELFIASNFDKERSNERPGTDAYVRKETASKAAAGASDSQTKLVGKWKMQLTMGDNTRDYELRIAKTGDRLEGTLVSPRTGEYKCKSVQVKDGDVVIVVEREFQGNQATFVYQGKLTAEGLAGKFSVKGQEDQFNGTWKASK